MKVYLMRHGQAESFAATDADRALTERGIFQARSMGPLVREAPPRRVYSSPYLRARQTAQCMLESLPEGTPFDVVDGITPDDDPRAVLQWLSTLPVMSAVLVVTHNPLVSSLVSLLVAGHLQGNVAMNTGDIACIDTGDMVSPGTGQLLWMQRAP